MKNTCHPLFRFFIRMDDGFIFCVLEIAMEKKEDPWKLVWENLAQWTSLTMIPLQKLVIDYLKPHQSMTQRTVLQSKCTFTSCVFFNGIYYYTSKDCIYSFDPNDPDCVSNQKCIFGPEHGALSITCLEPRTQTTTRIHRPRVVGVYQNHIYIQGPSLLYHLNHESGRVRLLVGETICIDYGDDHINHRIMGLDGQTSFGELISTVMTHDGAHLYTMDTKIKYGFSFETLYKTDTQTGQCAAYPEWAVYIRNGDISCMTWDRRAENSSQLLILFKNGSFMAYNLWNGRIDFNSDKPLTLQSQEISSPQNPCRLMESISGTGILILFSEHLQNLISVDPTTRECQMILDFKKDIHRCWGIMLDDSKRMLYMINNRFTNVNHDLMDPGTRSKHHLETISLSPSLFPVPFCCERDL